MPHFQPELATATTAALTQQAIERSQVTRTTIVFIIDENGAVSAWVVPDASPSERASWLESFGVNPNALRPSKFYALGYYNLAGSLILDGNDEGLKNLVEGAFRQYADEGEELFPVQRTS